MSETFQETISKLQAALIKHTALQLKLRDLQSAADLADRDCVDAEYDCKRLKDQLLVEISANV